MTATQPTGGTPMTSQHTNVSSFDSLVREWLPGKLGGLVDLLEYTVEDSGEDCLTIRLRVADRNGGVEVTYPDIPAPRADGIFVVKGQERVVVMAADRVDLERATIKCVGEQIRDEVEPRLTAPPDLPEYTAELLRAWLPLDRWIVDFLIHSPTSQPIDNCNWLARQTHLRRLRLPDDDSQWHSSHIGRVCPLETPEGPNVGRILHLATGAEVRDGRIVPADDSPVGRLGLSASMVPLIEHNDLPRQLMGCNMMRQWLDLGEREPALVRSGNEPDEAWYGRSFLTAYLFWKGMNYEDGIVVSESAAAKLASPDPLDVGDKLSNRHGTKGTVGAILPDSEMPRLPDGRPAELVFDLCGLHTRCNFGQIREAVLGNTAHTQGEPIVCPPYEAPTSEQVREMLREAGLPEDGQFQLSDPATGEALAMRSTVGYVYWGKTHHRAAEKVKGWVDGPPQVVGGMRQGEMENWALQTCGAIENILENVNTRSIDRAGVEELPKEIASGEVGQAPAPSALFHKLSRLLRTMGIEAHFEGEQVRFGLADPSSEDVALTVPVPHPWLPEGELTHIGPRAGNKGAYDRLMEANRRAARSLNGSAPETLRRSVQADLGAALGELVEQLDLGFEVRLGSRVEFSSRAVLTPGYDLQLGEVGLPEVMAWSLFFPFVAREVGNERARERGPEAREALDRAMAARVVLMNRAPTLQPTNVTAFRPVLRSGPTIKVHPLCCRLFNADFDGDQAAILLPVTPEAQAEAREKLTLEGHLKLDPGGVLACLTPSHSYLYGLAWAARSDDRRGELLERWPGGVPEPPRDLTWGWLVDAMRHLLEGSGVEAVLGVLQALVELGCELATRTGGSLHPFFGESLSLPPGPGHWWPGGWYWHSEGVDSAIMAQGDPESPDLGPQLLLVRTGARGNVGHLRQLIGPRGLVGSSPWGGPVVASGLRDGVTPAEHMACVPRVRAALQGVNRDVMSWTWDLRREVWPKSDTVLARAIRARRPGEVLAQAAADGEVDPLTDPSVRLWMGLRPEDGGRERR